MSGPMVKNHVSSRLVFGFNAIRRTTYQSWSWVYLRLPRQAHQRIQHHYRRKVKVQHLFQYLLIVGEQMSPNVGTWIHTQQKNQKKPTKIIIMHTNGVTRLIPKYLNGFKNSRRILWMETLLNLMEQESLFSVTHASSSNEPSLETLRRVLLGNHSIYTQFQKDRNCRSVRGPKLQGLLAEHVRMWSLTLHRKFGDLITADHKVLSDGSESRHSHRYAILVQDFATQWIQSYPCKN